MVFIFKIDLSGIYRQHPVSFHICRDRDRDRDRDKDKDRNNDKDRDKIKTVTKIKIKIKKETKIMIERPRQDSNLLLSNALIQDDQNMAVFFWYPGKSDFSCLGYCTRVHWTSCKSNVTETPAMFNWSPCIVPSPPLLVLEGDGRALRRIHWTRIRDLEK